MDDNVTSGDDPPIFIITGTVRKADSTELIPFNALLSAADDDSAVRSCLNALAQKGYEEANLDKIGNLLGRPEDEKFQEAYDAALNGAVALVIFEGGTSSME
jgi:hypothetical protein